MTENSVPRVLWKPDEERAASSNIVAFARWAEREKGVRAFGDASAASFDYDSLWRWSVTDVDGFWESVWEYYGVRSETPYERVLGERTMPGAEWFPGATLNYARHVFEGRDDDRVAIRHATELRGLGEWTWGDLRRRTAAIAAGLRGLGVGPGDRVVAYLPNLPETVAAFYAAASLGAVWSSCSPDFGVRSVIDRFAQIEPKVLLAVDGYRYGGKDFDRRPVVEELRAALPTVEHTVLLDYLHPGEFLDGTLPWGRLEESGAGAELEFASVPFDHPLWVLYSSGTTGLPKAIVHGHGGILLEQLKNLHLHLDAQEHDRVFWFTTTGWMMWNFLVSVLLTKASIVLYDGSPAHPSPSTTLNGRPSAAATPQPDLGALWDLAAEAGVTVFGTSAGFLSSCMKEGVHPRRGRDLSALKAIGSTGSPLSPEAFSWVYEEFGEDLWLFSTSGGTDVCSCLVGGTPTLPVHEGEIQSRALGMAVASWDPDGKELVNEVGELVVTEPAPSMPLFLWGDDSGERLRESYFSVYPGVWRHGDWIAITDRGTAVIYGRSDSTINRGGVRMGTSEIYRAVLALDEVVDALVVDVPQADGSSRIELFTVLREGADLEGDLPREIARRIRTDCSPRHVPDRVRVIGAVPRTLSGKVLEVPVKRILMGERPDRVASRDSLANPAALDFFSTLAGERENTCPGPLLPRGRRHSLTGVTQNQSGETSAAPAGPSSGRDRIDGIDAARALAVFGMFVVHLGVESMGLLSPEGYAWDVHGVVRGNSSALFALLAGTSLAMMTGRTDPVGGDRLRGAVVRILTRAALIGVLGLVLDLMGVPVAIILTYYAGFFVLALPLLKLRSGALWTVAGALAVLGPPLSFLLRDNVFPPSPRTSSLASLSEFLLTGYYPAITFMAFVTAGMALGRLDLAATAVRLRLLASGAALLLLGHLGSWVLLGPMGGMDRLVRASGPALTGLPSGEVADEATAALVRAAVVEETQSLSGQVPTDSWWWLAVGTPHTGTTFEIAEAVGQGLVVLVVCMFLCDRFRVLMYPLTSVGRMPLTVYTGHILALAVVIAASGGIGWHQPWLLEGFVLGALVFATLWRLTAGRGPAELLLGEAADGVVALVEERRSAADGRLPRRPSDGPPA